jgi:DNA polymerase-4
MTDVLHVDMNSFFASVEILDNPSLRGLPVVVGGGGKRGVVCSASYEARVFGVRAAMPIYKALQCCPKAVLLPVRISRYRLYNKRFLSVLDRVTPFVEPVALDEAYLDISHAHTLFGDSLAIGRKIYEDLFSETGLTCSIGISQNKLLAKLASKAAKPKILSGRVENTDPVLLISSAEEELFLDRHSVAALPGIGRKTVEKLSQIGVKTVADLKILSLSTLVAKFGTAQGKSVFVMARGIGSAEVVPNQERKSLGKEETFAIDLVGIAELLRQIDMLAEEVYFVSKRAELLFRCVSVKVKFSNFEVITRSKTQETPFLSFLELKSAVHAMVTNLDLKLGVRLCGVQVSGFVVGPHDKYRQTSLFDAESDVHAKDALEEVTLGVKEKFGNQAIGYGIVR